jgi:phosphate transport system permease protein
MAVPVASAAPAMPATRRPADLVAAAPASSQPLRRGADRAFLLLCLAFTALAVLILVVLLFTVWRDGHGRLSTELLTNYASRRPGDAGVKAALWGSI